jgi:hypothetical protein
MPSDITLNRKTNYNFRKHVFMKRFTFYIDYLHLRLARFTLEGAAKTP